MDSNIYSNSNFAYHLTDNDRMIYRLPLLRYIQFCVFAILILISCENKREPGSVYPTTQIYFQDSVQRFTTLPKSAESDKERAMTTRQQEEWIKQYFEEHTEIKDWIGIYELSDADTTEMIITIEDFGVADFQYLITPYDTALRKMVASIPSRSLVRFSASRLRLMEFEKDEKKGYLTLRPHILMHLNFVAVLEYNNLKSISL